MSLSLYKNVINKMCLEIICLIYMYKEDLALNNLQWLICHKTQTNLSFDLQLSYTFGKGVNLLCSH